MSSLASQERAGRTGQYGLHDLEVQGNGNLKGDLAEGESPEACRAGLHSHRPYLGLLTS